MEKKYEGKLLVQKGLQKNKDYIMGKILKPTQAYFPETFVE